MKVPFRVKLLAVLLFPVVAAAIAATIALAAYRVSRRNRQARERIARLGAEEASREKWGDPW